MCIRDRTGGLEEQIRKAVEAGSKNRKLDDLKKEGFDVVKVVDYSTIQRLIGEAIDKIILQRSMFLLDEQQDQLKGQAHKEFQKLLLEQKKSIIRAEQLDAAKRKVEEELDKLQEMVGSKKGLPDTQHRSYLEVEIKKMGERQKILLDKYKRLDDERRSLMSDNFELKLKLGELTEKIETMKSRGAGAPSEFIKDINELRDAREILRRRVNLLKKILQNLAVETNLLRQGQEPKRAPVGKGVQLIVGDTNTPYTGIKVKFNPATNEPSISFP
mgnify:CR=1 FL=1